MMDSISNRRYHLENVLYNLQSVLKQSIAVTEVPEAGRVEQSIKLWENFLQSLRIDLNDKLDIFEFVNDADVDLFDLLIGSAKERLVKGRDDVAETMRELDQLLHKFCRQMIAIVEAVSESQHADQKLDVDTRRHLNDAAELTLTGLRNLRLLDENEEALRSAKEAQALAQGAAKGAVEARDNAQAAAGSAAESRLADTYERYGKEEAKTSRAFRWATIVLVVIGVLIAFLLPHSEGWPLGEAIYRVAVLAGVFGLAGYLARQAGHHRSIAVWAQSISVQLQTFEAFLEPINESDLKNQIRLNFATRVFGATPQLKPEASPAPSTALVETVVGTVMKNGSRAT